MLASDPCGASIAVPARTRRFVCPARWRLQWAKRRLRTRYRCGFGSVFAGSAKMRRGSISRRGRGRRVHGLKSLVVTPPPNCTF